MSCMLHQLCPMVSSVCDWAQLRTDGQAGEYADGQAAAGGQGRFGWLALLLGSQLGWLSCLVLS